IIFAQRVETVDSPRLDGQLSPDDVGLRLLVAGDLDRLDSRLDDRDLEDARLLEVEPNRVADYTAHVALLRVQLLDRVDVLIEERRVEDVPLFGLHHRA